MAGTLTVVTWGGHSINDGTVYTAVLTAADSMAGNGPTGVAIETELPGRGATYVRTDIRSRTLVLRVIVKTETRANLEQIKKWFDPRDGQQYLVVQDDDANQRRILCVPEQFRQRTPGTNTFDVTLLASSPYWEEASVTTPTPTAVTASGQTFSLTNSGNARAYPSFTITPNTVMSHANSWIRRRRVVIANRSELPITDPVGDGWPVNVFDTTLDTDALNTAGKLQSDLDDLRVVLEGAEINRWPDPATDNASSRLWCNLQYRPRKTATLAAIASSSSPADGGSISVTNAQGTAGWPDAGFLLIDSECIQYAGRTATAFTGITRGARATTAAAHSAGTAYWVEHPFLDVIYDYTAAASPSPPDDRKPVIDLTNSTNSKFVWASPFLNNSDRRSAAWQRLFTDEGFTADYIRCYETGGTLVFEDTAPVAGKPKFNNVIMDVPYGIKAAAAAVELDFTVNNAFVLRGFLTDFEGYENSLITQGPTSALTNQQFTPGAAAPRLRLGARNGVLIGNRSGSSTAPVNSGTAGNYVEFFRFTLSKEAIINSMIVYLQDGSPASANGVNFILASSGKTIAGTTTAHGNIPNASVPPNGAPADVQVTFSSPVKLAAGTYSLYACQDAAASNSVLLTYGTANINPQMPDTNGVQTYRVAFLTLSSDAQSGSLVDTGDDLTIDNIELTFDNSTPRTPKIVVGSEETLYLANFRLQNDTTGDYLTVYFPMTLGESVVIDCENRTITDGETGRQIPFAIDSSNPTEWPYLPPGSSTWSYTETGVVSVTVAPSFRGRWN